MEEDGSIDLSSEAPSTNFSVWRLEDGVEYLLEYVPSREMVLFSKHWTRMSSLQTPGSSASMMYLESVSRTSTEGEDRPSSLAMGNLKNEGISNILSKMESMSLRDRLKNLSAYIAEIAKMAPDALLFMP